MEGVFARGVMVVLLLLLLVEHEEPGVEDGLGSDCPLHQRGESFTLRFLQCFTIELLPKGPHTRKLGYVGQRSDDANLHDSISANGPGGHHAEA